MLHSERFSYLINLSLVLESEEITLRPITNNKAFGLIEVLITAAILSIGLIGIASLHSRTTQAVKEGDNKVVASMIAKEMSLRMLNNAYITALGRPGYLATDINGDISTQGGVVPWATWVQTNNAYITNCYAADDTESCVEPGDDINISADHITGLTNMQLMDEVEMRLLADDLLPDGEIMICFDSTNPYTTWSCDNTATRVSARNENVYTIKVRWTNIFTNTTDQYTLQFTAECTDPSATGCGN